LTRFQGVKFGFSENRLHQPTRLSQAHLLVSSDLISKHFQFLVIFPAQVKMSTSTKLVDKLEGVKNFCA
jgi:hypothetical protein